MLAVIGRCLGAGSNAILTTTSITLGASYSTARYYAIEFMLLIFKSICFLLAMAMTGKQAVMGLRASVVLLIFSIVLGRVIFADFRAGRPGKYLRKNSGPLILLKGHIHYNRALSFTVKI
ncbi:MAG: hypothetical protein PHR16_06710 [Methylovulum sp.]|nr:hypothetical protein [Methylovulum sp.]